MLILRHGRAPGVEYRGHTDPGAEMFLVGGDGDRGFSTGFEQQVVNDPFVLIGDVGDRLRQGEDQVEIADRQQFGLAFGEPGSGGGPLALRTALST